MSQALCLSPKYTNNISQKYSKTFQVDIDTHAISSDQDTLITRLPTDEICFSDEENNLLHFESVQKKIIQKKIQHPIQELQHIIDLTEQDDQTNEEKNSIINKTNIVSGESLNLRKKLPQEKIIQEWEGRVTQVYDKHFLARLLDITEKRDTETEEAEFSLDDLSDYDKNRVRNGAIFRCVIGYEKRKGTVTRFSRIVFRRLPVWRIKDFKSADARAEELYNDIQWD